MIRRLDDLIRPANACWLIYIPDIAQSYPNNLSVFDTWRFREPAGLQTTSSLHIWCDGVKLPFSGYDARESNWILSGWWCSQKSATAALCLLTTDTDDCRQDNDVLGTFLTSRRFTLSFSIKPQEKQWGRRRGAPHSLITLLIIFSLLQTLQTQDFAFMCYIKPNSPTIEIQKTAAKAQIWLQRTEVSWHWLVRAALMIYNETPGLKRHL